MLIESVFLLFNIWYMLEDLVNVIHYTKNDWTLNVEIKSNGLYLLECFSLWRDIKAKTISFPGSGESPHALVANMLDCNITVLEFYRKLSIHESVLTVNYELEWDYMDIGMFHYSKVAKSIHWIVSSWWPREWAY